MIYVSGQSNKNYKQFSQETLEERDQQYLDVLQSNLRHPNVELIHLFFLDFADLEVCIYII